MGPLEDQNPAVSLPRVMQLEVFAVEEAAAAAAAEKSFHGLYCEECSDFPWNLEAEGAVEASFLINHRETRMSAMACKLCSSIQIGQQFSSNVRLLNL